MKKGGGSERGNEAFRKKMDFGATTIILVNLGVAMRGLQTKL
jgi:hypothetical protein